MIVTILVIVLAVGMLLARRAGNGDVLIPDAYAHQYGVAGWRMLAAPDGAPAVTVPTPWPPKPAAVSQQ